MTIGTGMLIGLGFLIALLLAAVIAPAYRRRTERLTTEALKRTLPLTEAEIRAEKDRLRAEHAIRIHNLETKLENVSLSSTRQKIEVNRRDARISELEGFVTEQKTKIEELENARRVLEQTVTDRLPRIEGRLNDARKLLLQRDGEIATLAETAQKQARAIAEALQIDVQQSAEIDRLNSALSTRAARGQDTAGDARFDGEIALRSEIEALRAKGREQAALISNLQEVIGRPKVEPAQTAAALNAAAAEAEVARLSAELAEARAAESRTPAGENEAASALRLKAQDLERTNAGLSAEISRLKDALAAIEAAESDKRSKDSPIAAKARIASLEAQIREQAATIQSLQTETAAINERLARQAAHYMDEIKRLGGGSLPTAADARRPRAEPAKRSLFDRISDARVVQLAPRAANEAGDSESGSESAVKPLFDVKEAAGGLSEAAPVPSGAGNGSGTSPAGASEPITQPTAPPRRPRLLERITSIEKPGSN